MTELGQMPLWPQGIPSTLEQHWQQLKNRLLGLHEGWSVWTDWYEARLTGQPAPIEQLELARALIEDELWEQGPGKVNPHIKQLIEQYRPEKKADLGQRLAPYVFYAKDGKIYAKPLEGDPIYPDMAEDLRAGLKDKLEKLQERMQGLQVPSDAQESLRDLLGVLGDYIDDVKPGQLLNACDSLEADIAAYDSDEGREQFSPEAQAKFKKVLMALSRLKASFPEIGNLEATALAQNMTGPMAEQFMKETSEPLLKGAIENPDIISKDALEGLEAGIPLIKKLMYKAQFAMDDLTRAKAWQELGKQVAKHSGNLRNYAAAVLDEAQKSKFAREAKRTGKAYTTDFSENAGKFGRATGISGGTMAFAQFFACAMAGGLVFSLAVPVAGAVALGLSAWAQLPKEIEDLKEQQKKDDGKEDPKD